MALTYEDNLIGYAKTKKKADQAKSLVVDASGTETGYVEEVFDEKLKVEEVKVSVTELNDVHDLSKSIVDTVDELEDGYGVYLGEELYCTFKNKIDAEFVVSCLTNQIKKEYNTLEYDVLNTIDIRKGNYVKSTMSSFSEVALDYIYKNLKIQTYKHTEKVIKLKYDVVYVVNDNFQFGESNILSKGKMGKCKYYYKTTFLNGVKQSKNIVKTEVMSEPKTKAIEISREEYNILMANKAVDAKNYVFPLNTNNYYVSSLFGYRWGRVHGGIDLDVATNTGIRAYKAGTVLIAEYNESYGNYIVVEHDNGLKTLYAHCSSLLADVGSSVKKGQIIALSGNTGNSTGPHLHFEVRINDERVDPAKYIGIYAKENKDSQKVNDIIKTVNMTASQIEFINSIKDAAIEGYQHYNILPSLTLSQAIIESAWGKSAIGNNIFGIKAFSDWKGPKKCVWTSEERSDGTSYRTKAWFKDYDNFNESVYDHTRLLLTERYRKVREANNYREACYAVKEAGYATSSSYAETLINTIETYGLYAWDNINYKVEKDKSVKKNNKIDKKVQKNTEKSKKHKKNNKQKPTTTKADNITTKSTTAVEIITETTQPTTVAGNNVISEDSDLEAGSNSNQ